MPQSLSELGAHDEAEVLLPWYATGQLEPGERVLVETHLSSCADCRRQLTLERRLIQDFRDSSPEVDAGWARIRHRVAPPPPGRRRPQRRGRIWNVIRQPAVAALAAAQVGFLVLTGGLLLSLSRPDYHALGSPPASPSADVIVIFRADATVDDVRDALRAANASIVGGPTEADAFLLRIPQKERQRGLARLRADDDVQMAEPIDEASR
jgi:anti-sigma-K factor RskA